MRRELLPDVLVITILVAALAALFFWRRELLALAMSIGGW